MSSSRPVAGIDSFVRRLDAWRTIMDYAIDKINFVQLDEALSKISDRAVQHWRPLLNYLLEEEDQAAAINAVEKEMMALGVSFTESNTVPVLAGGPKRRRSEATSSRKRHKASVSSARRYLDLEAQVSDDEDENESDGERDNFVVPDSADVPSGQPAASSRIYGPSSVVRPSRYSDAIEALAQRYEGDRENEVDEADDDEEYQLLDDSGIWSAIDDWLYGSKSFSELTSIIDFHQGKLRSVGYWEDFVSQLAFESDLDKRDAMFNAVSLEEHHRRRSNNVSNDTSCPHSRSRVSGVLATSPSPPSSPIQEHAPVLSESRLWSVRVTPTSSAHYIAEAWSKRQLKASVVQSLPGRIHVWSPDQRTFVRALPPSHASCLRSWLLVPAEDLVSPKDLFDVLYPEVPAWGLISKRGRYRGDLAYILSLEKRSGMVDVLVASRELEPPPQHTDDEKIGRDLHARRLFTPELYSGGRCAPVHGLVTYQYHGRRYASGLLLMQVPQQQLQSFPTPSPHQIALHSEAAINPAFMKATLDRFHHQFWKAGDILVVNDAQNFNLKVRLVVTDHATRSIVVETLDEGQELMVSVSSAQRLFSRGDIVRVIADPHSDTNNVHNENMGKYGIVIDVDMLTREVTFLDDTQNPTRAPPYLLESYVPDQPLANPDNACVVDATGSGQICCPQIGDSGFVESGVCSGTAGIVIAIYGAMVRLHRIDGHNVDVPAASVTFTPPASALKFTLDRGYNVRPGDAVEVVRGRLLGKKGVVKAVDLQKKTLEVAELANSSSFVIPITFAGHDGLVSDCDQAHRQRGKEVLIICGEYKGWRGTLRSISEHTCEVAPGNAPSFVVQKNNVVVRGAAATLGGEKLSVAQVLEVLAAFQRGAQEDTKGKTRAKTPPPSPPTTPAAPGSGPWVVDALDAVDTTGSVLTKLDFVLHPIVKENLKLYHAVFKITGWKGVYDGRRAMTDIPDPLQSASGDPVPHLHLAVNFTSHSKGAALLHENIHEHYLEPHPPREKNTLCMVIKEGHGAESEPVGRVLRVISSSIKNRRVKVCRLDGEIPKEKELPWDRVIRVEEPTSTQRSSFLRRS